MTRKTLVSLLLLMMQLSHTTYGPWVVMIRQLRPRGLFFAAGFLAFGFDRNTNLLSRGSVPSLCWSKRSTGNLCEIVWNDWLIPPGLSGMTEAD
jgi:hypothetical protein